MERIENSRTINTDFYTSNDMYEKVKEQIFARSWQYVCHERNLMYSGQQFPLTYMEGLLDEPLFLSRDNDEVHCLSNVCTHRGNLLIKHPQKKKKLVCDYHGRRFALNGKFEYMPEFETAENFPSPCDNLTKIPLTKWGPYFFVSLEPGFELQNVLNEMNKRVGFLPLSDFKFDELRSKDYLVNANWALYCENYLEGFHIPFVHPDLNKALEGSEYESISYEHCNLQIGYGKDDTLCFELPEGHIDYGKRVAAYYYWIYPNMMFNFYPWGLSINIVRPLGLKKCKVSFLSYVLDESKIGDGAGALLDKVEREDEYVVENVMRGIQSRYYKYGRYSPTMERNVHHFHELLKKDIPELVE